MQDILIEVRMMRRLADIALNCMAATTASFRACFPVLHQ